MLRDPVWPVADMVGTPLRSIPLSHTARSMRDARAYNAMRAGQRLAPEPRKSRLNGFDLVCILVAVAVWSLFGAILVSWLGQ